MAPSPNPGKPTVLALDTATTGCSACVWRAGQALAAESDPMARGQAGALMPMIDRVLDAAGVLPGDLDAVAVTRGPGAFTGLRIALATARGFALALGVPCVGVTTLEAVAHGVPAQERTGAKVLACVESKREDIFVQVFADDLTALSAPLACGVDAIAGLFEAGEALLLVGDAAVRAQTMLQDAGADVSAHISTAAALPDPVVVAAIAATRLDGNAPPPEPLYLRPPDAKLPKAEGRLRA